MELIKLLLTKEREFVSQYKKIKKYFKNCLTYLSKYNKMKIRGNL